MQTTHPCDSRERGSVLVFSLIALVLLGAFAGATFVVVQKSSAQQRSFATRTELYAHAETGVRLALHDMRFGSTGNDGNLGTINWTTADDVGVDGYPSTGDKGELDGVPTPGEPNVIPAAIGPTGGGQGLITFVTDSGFPGVQRVVSTATDGETMVTVEHYTKQDPVPIPITSAVYATPTASIDLIGNRFEVNGNDHTAAGAPGPNPAIYGISTTEGATPGENAGFILAQIDPSNYDQITGLGPNPSIGEVPDIDFDPIFDMFASYATNTLTTGAYTNYVGGDYSADDFQVTYVQGDVTLSGQCSGAGVLVVEGSLDISGKLEFKGLVLVRGDMIITGGGSGVNLLGSVMIGQSITAVQPQADVTVSGNAKIRYSSEVLDTVSDNVLGDYQLIYYDEY